MEKIIRKGDIVYFSRLHEKVITVKNRNMRGHRYQCRDAFTLIKQWERCIINMHIVSDIDLDESADVWFFEVLS